ncbi:uncharacterized protein LOC124817258 [Hydra vulgaris]|uniref:uncharacterized protein LOC124817258 n=1 Tax=Hydra vulgaris TaxID=6087 RepID=UPI001F5F34EF|nr:uncharacterized protein LOC124817258 [Hydra vulgaris]
MLKCKNELSIINKHLQKYDSKLDSSSLTSNSKNKNVKLPILKLEPFDGKPENWVSFIENFNCTVNYNEDLSNIQKMTYLRNLLQGPAQASITGLALTNENYETAFDVLKRRYDNKQALISSHMRKLLSLERINSINRIEMLRKFFVSLEIQVRSLENLGISSNMYGPLLIPIILEKIPEELTLIINHQYNNNDNWDVKSIIDFLTNELSAREQTLTNSFNKSEQFFTAETLHTGTNNREPYQTYPSNSFNRGSHHNLRRNNLDKGSYFKRNTPRDLHKLNKCLFCEQPHKSQNCRSITNIQSRKKIISDKKLCFKCLESGHISKQCLSRIKCFKCGRHHHSALCIDTQNFNLQNQAVGQLTSIAEATSEGYQSILLQTASAQVFDNNAKLHSCRILFDNYSQLSYLSPNLHKKLKLRTLEVLDKVELPVKCLFGRTIQIICYVKEICSPLNGQYISEAKQKSRHLNRLRLADYNLNGDDKIIREYKDSHPIALKSQLGFLLSGPIYIDKLNNNESGCNVNTTHVMLVDSTNSKSLVKDSMAFIWGIGEFENSQFDIIDNFRHTINYNEAQKQYSVRLPFKENHFPICDNYSLCINRLKYLQKRLSKDKRLLQSYNDIIKDQSLQGIIEPVHYLPHRPVLRSDKITSKVRIVFDASSAAEGPSLNECLSAEPSLTTSLYGVLLRSQKIAYIADIEKAFLQIALPPLDRDYVRFLWFKDLNGINSSNIYTKEIISYRLCRVLFDVTSSPFLLSATLKKHAERYIDSDPNFVYKLMNTLHVDNLNAGANSIYAAFQFYQKCKYHLQEAGFNLRKFESNCKDLENLVNEQSFKSHNTTKVLGLNWNKEKDILTFDLAKVLTEMKANPTKRDILRFIASIFDPLGIINPVVVRLKIFFQEVCSSKVEWDTKLEDIICWTDSTIALHWINNTKKVYHTFIQKRVRKIREDFDITHWKYVDSRNNPADIASRGTDIVGLRNCKHWFNGPLFLCNNLNDWPKFDLVNQPMNIVEEILTNIVASDTSINLNMVDIKKLNSYTLLIRVTALVLRFIRNLKKKKAKKSLKLSPLDSSEIDYALKIWIQYTQQTITSTKNYKQIQRDLNLRKVDGIIRCYGRLENAPIPSDMKYPIFLPRDSEFTDLVIYYHHSIVMYNGVKETLNQLRTESCVCSLRRFIAKRGASVEITSDNGSHLISKVTQDFISSRGISWHFNPPAAPLWGGYFERLVAPTKRCLRKVIANARLTYEELLTILAEVEAVVNNRPITFTYNKPGDTPLTPNHLLYGRTLNFLAIEDDNIEYNLNARSAYISNVLNHYWKRWRDEYVTELREYHKHIKWKGNKSNCNKRRGINTRS